MAVTIYEVAERAGVSSSTVARILRGDVKESQQRSAATAGRVRKIAKEMGYRTNHRARAFSRGQTHSIGLLYTDDRWLFEGVNTQVINSLVTTLQSKGYHLVFVPIDDRRSWFEIIGGGQIDGALTFQPLPSEVSETLRESNVATVSLGDDSDPSLPQVLVDDYAGAYSAVRYFINCGHRKLLFYVHDSVKSHCSIRERERGFNKACEEDPAIERATIRGPEEEAVAVLMNKISRPTAVLCYSNLESTLLTHAMWQYGIDVPGEVSLVGFNDLFSTQYMTPPLTTVAFDTERIGKLGAKLILSQIESSDASHHAVIESIKPKLIVRGSSGPPVL